MTHSAIKERHCRMREIKLVGREVAVLRAMESAGSTGQYLQERTAIEPQDLLDILNGLFETGFVEAYLPDQTMPAMEQMDLSQLAEARFEINPAYYQQLKAVLQRH